MTQHTTRAHAKRSPSAAYRWMNCPGSIRMSDGITERKSSVFADEGTAAHMLAEHCLRNGHDADKYARRVIDINGDCFSLQFLMAGSPITAGRFEVDDEMVEGVQLFLDTVRGSVTEGCELRIESRVNFGNPDDFGTADAMVFDPALGHLHVLDLKYGSGVLVEVVDEAGNPNPQLVCYGEGGARLYPDISGLAITIVQPRMPHPDGPVRTVDIGPLELLDWSIKIAEALAATEEPDAPLNPGSWCDWCPAAGICPAYASKALAVAQSDFEDLTNPPVTLPSVDALSNEDLSAILTGLPLLKAWIKAIDARAYAIAEETPGAIPGFKIVDKVARRQWTYQNQVVDTLHEIGCGGDIYTEPKLKSPAQIETQVGKKVFAEKLAVFAPPVSSGTTLVPSSDKRPAASLKIEDEFDVIEE